MIARFKKILLVRFSSMGDILLTTPLLRVLQTRLEDARIDYVTKDTFVPLLEHNPRISRVWELQAPHGIKELRALCGRLRAENYELVVDVHRNLRSRLLRWWLKRPSTVYRKGAIRRALYVHFKIRSCAPKRPVRSRYFDAVRHLDLQDDGGSLEFYLTDAEREWAESKLKTLGSPRGKLYVGLAIGAGKATKRWPTEHFAHLAHWLRKELDAVVLLFGDAGDRPAGEYIRQELGKGVLNFAGETDLRQTAALLSRCDAVVTNDSGLMHLADALGKKMVVIFGGTTPELGFAPLGGNVTIIERSSLPCRPCSHVGRDKCPRGHFKCMKEVKPETVKEALTKLISTSSK